MPTALQDPFPSVQLTWQMNSNGPGRGAQRSSEPCSFVTDSLVSNGHAGTEGRSQEQSPGWEKLERTGRQVTQRSDISVRVTCGGKERDRKRERDGCEVFVEGQKWLYVCRMQYSVGLSHTHSH